MKLIVFVDSINESFDELKFVIVLNVVVQFV